MDETKKIGRYVILEELGQGAMGTVYRAKDPAMDRIVALKTIISVVLASDKGSEFRERFYREARAAGALAHPGIVTVFDVGEHEGVPFLVMEFIKGRTLADAVKQGERLSLDRVCEIGQKIAEALGHAHQHGVVHRDIKPANILLTSKENHGIERPKITDFGVAKLAEGQTTMTGQLLGTPAFMPPEQFTGSPIDGRADIFSLGVVLYWMATGEQPFPGESMTAVSYKVVHTEPVPPRKLNPSLPEKLEAIIMKCLSKSPDDRYQTAEELARELGDLRAGRKAAVLQTATAPSAAGNDPNATRIEDVSPAQIKRTIAAQTGAASVVTSTSQSAEKSNSRLVLGAGLAVVIVVAGLYGLRSKQKPALQASPQSVVAPSEPASPRTPEAESGPAQVAGNVAPKPVPAAKAAAIIATAPLSAPVKLEAGSKQVTKTALSEKVSSTKAPPPMEPVRVDFDPRALDPKTNSRLKIEADQFPAGLDFIVELNGKLYLRRSAEGNKAEFDGLFVPPGVQEFRVIATSGDTQKISNIVSSEFKAKKKTTLKIELRLQGMPPGSGVPQGLYSNSQLVATLK